MYEEKGRGRDNVTDLSSSWYNTVLRGSGSDRISMDSLTAMMLKGKGVCSRSSVHCADNGSMEFSSATFITLGWSDTKTSMRMLASSTDAAMSLLLCCPKASGWSVYGIARMTYGNNSSNDSKKVK